jgi:hypothetical protein
MQTNTAAVEVYFSAEEVCFFTVAVEVLNTMTVRKVSSFELGQDLLQSCGTLGVLEIICDNTIGRFFDRY